MKTLIILGFLCATQLVSSQDFADSLRALRDKFAATETADPEAAEGQSVPDAESAFSKLVSKLNTDAKTDTATTLTAANQARGHNFNPYPPSRYGPYSNPYTNRYASPYGTPNGFAAPRPVYNPFAAPTTTTAAINPLNPPRYYKDPAGKLYNVNPDGSLYDTATGATYLTNSRGERILIGANKTGFGTDYIVAPDGSTYTEVGGIRYKVDDAISADGKRYYTDASGQRFNTDANGNKMYTDNQGRNYFIDSSGNTIYVRADGVQYYTDATGTTYYKNKDGTVYYTGSNGVTYYQDPTNGDAYTKDTAGNTYRTRIDGTAYIVATGGCRYNVGSGGVTTLTSTTTTTTTNCPATFTGTSPEGISFTG